MQPRTRVGSINRAPSRYDGWPDRLSSTVYLEKDPLYVAVSSGAEPPENRCGSEAGLGLEDTTFCLFHARHVDVSPQ